MAADFEFVVNGRRDRINEDPSAPLLLVLRNNLGLRGTRHGCGTGNCGACTVLLDGRPITSCNTPVEAIAGQTIETIEAFDTDPLGKALITAFIDEQAGQCGYCLAGILVAAKALLTRNTSPSRHEIIAALDDHLCRCGAHQRIIRAIELAASNLAGGQAA